MSERSQRSTSPSGSVASSYSSLHLHDDFAAPPETETGTDAGATYAGLVDGRRAAGWFYNYGSEWNDEGSTKYSVMDLLGGHAATALVAGGILFSGAMAGTSTTAPIPVAHVRHVDGTSSGGRVFFTNRIVSGLVGRAAISSRNYKGGALSTETPSAPPSSPPTAAVPASISSDYEEMSSPAEDVSWLHAASGLTWDQLGKAFGVSRRSVHMWATGGRLNATNAERLARFVAIVRALRGNTPDERRAELLAPGTTGVSILDKFRTELELRPAVTGSPYTPDQLIGARHDRVVDGT